MAEQPNVLLLVVDACRADYVSPYEPDAETPAIESLADDGTVYRRAVSPAPWTLPSATSLLTGDYPHEHGATSRHFGSDAPTLMDDLSDVGYRCVHYSPTTWIGDWLPQGRGFDDVVEFTGPTHRYFDGGADVRDLSQGVARGTEWYRTVTRRALDSESPLLSLGNALAFQISEAAGDAWRDDYRASETAAEEFSDRLGALSRDDRPFFAYVHLMDPHLPLYLPRSFESPVLPPGAETREDEHEYMADLMDDIWAVRSGNRTLSADELAYLRTRYADAVEYADAALGRILDALSDHGLEDDTLVGFTADHGEHLGEHVDGRTMLDHQTSVRFPLLRVPFIVRYPGTFDDADCDDLVQPHYLASTIRALAGVEHDSRRSLLTDADGRRSTALAEYDGVVRSHPPDAHVSDEFFRRRATAVQGEWKLDVVGNERRAARLDWDANEARTVDESDIPPDVRRSLESALKPPLPDVAEADELERGLPKKVERRLDNLGYR